MSITNDPSRGIRLSNYFGNHSSDMTGGPGDGFSADLSATIQEKCSGSLL
jgi:hypothetical protein